MISSSSRRSSSSASCNNGNSSPSLQSSTTRRSRRIATTTTTRQQQQRSSRSNHRLILRVVVVIFVLCWSFVAFRTIQRIKHQNDNNKDNVVRIRRQQQSQNAADKDSPLSMPCWKNQTDDGTHPRRPPLLKYTLHNPPKIQPTDTTTTTTTTTTATTIPTTSILHAVITPTFSSSSSASSLEYNFNNNETLQYMYQNHYSILQHSRIELLKTVCEPSLRYQTSQNMIWFIIVDGSFEAKILEELSTIIDKYNIYQMTRPKIKQSKPSDTNRILPMFTDELVITHSLFSGRNLTSTNNQKVLSVLGMTLSWNIKIIIYK